METFTIEHLLRIIAFQSEIAGSPMDVGFVINRTAVCAQDLLQADGALVELLEGGAPAFYKAVGIAAGVAGLASESWDRPPCLRECPELPLLCEDTEVDARVDGIVCGQLGLRSLVVVPLQHQGMVVGRLNVVSRAPHHFGPTDLTTLELLSHVIAAAMSHAAEHETQLAQLETLYRMATRDPLTELINRRLFFEQFRQSLALAQRQESLLLAGMVDMDGLKALNDDHGHRVGDAALMALGDRLRRAVRASDLVARLGGDEFGVLLTAVASRQDAQEPGRKLKDPLEGSFVHEGSTYPLHASVGWACYPDDGSTPEALMACADQRMYQAKRTQIGQREGMGASTADGQTGRVRHRVIRIHLPRSVGSRKAHT